MPLSVTLDLKQQLRVRILKLRGHTPLAGAIGRILRLRCLSSYHAAYAAVQEE